MICFDEKNIITPIISDKLKGQIEQAGYTVHMVDLSEFIKGGGGPHCLTNRINQLHVQQSALQQTLEVVYG